MEFKVGEKVVHPFHGVGKVVGKEEKKFFDKDAQMYYEVETPKLTIWVPVEDGDNPGLRSLTKRSDLPEFRDLLKSAPKKFAQNYRTRQSQIKSLLQDGSLAGMIRVVRDLKALERKKTVLNDSDNRSLRDAYDHLCQEWAAIKGTTVSEASREIDRLLAESNEAAIKKEAKGSGQSMEQAFAG